MLIGETQRETRDRRSLTRIVATVGPASSSPEMIERLIESGVSIFRLNFSHGDPDTYAQIVADIRRIAPALDRATAVLGDLQGPKIRVGAVAGDAITVERGGTVVFQRAGAARAADAPATVVPTSYEQLTRDVRPGERLLVNDGAVRMLVVETADDDVTCTVVHGGTIASGKGINLPDTMLTVETISDRDWDYVDWSIEHDLDFLALSFTRCAGDVRTLRAGVEARAARRGRPDFHLRIVAKIEVPEAVHAAESIIDAADAIMIARGDLGVEMDLAEVPVIQKELVGLAAAHGKPTIVATQMLESMIAAPTPTRAEASDVASAIVERADAVMLSGETAVGRYPVLAVEAMRRIACRTEAWLATHPRSSTPPEKLRAARSREAALAHGVWTIRRDADAQAVVVWSESGQMARYLSQNVFDVPIFAVTSDERAARQMQIMRGVSPHFRHPPDGVAGLRALAEAYMCEHEIAAPGDLYVLVAGEPLGMTGVTSTIGLHAVGEPLAGR